MPRSDIYIDIDSIFDTRYSILSILDSKLAKKSMDSDYLARTIDEFDYMSYDFFKLLYADRDMNVFKISKLTHMLKLVGQYISEAGLMDTQTGGDGDINLYVNIFPYAFTNEISNEIKLSLIPYLTHVNDIIFISVENISPNWIYDNVGTMIAYNMLEWTYLNTALGTIQEENLLEILFIAPKLFNNPAVKADDKTFENLTKETKILSNITFIDTFHFSIAL